MPRLRYDQFMRLGWKVLVPANLVWIVLIVALRAFRNEGGVSTQQVLLFGGVAVLVLIGFSLLLPDRRVPDEEQVEVTGGGYPVPPLDLEVPKPPARKAAARPARRPKARIGARPDAPTEDRETD